MNNDGYSESNKLIFNLTRQEQYTKECIFPGVDKKLNVLTKKT